MIVTIRQFARTQYIHAEHARLALELSRHGEGVEREIVVLEASNLSELRTTHRRYFETAKQLATD